MGGTEREAYGQVLQLGPPVLPFYPLLGDGSPTKIDYRKSSTEDLAKSVLSQARRAMYTPYPVPVAVGAGVVAAIIQARKIQGQNVEGTPKKTDGCGSKPQVAKMGMVTTPLLSFQQAFWVFTGVPGF